MKMLYTRVFNGIWTRYRKLLIPLFRICKLMDTLHSIKQNIKMIPGFSSARKIIYRLLNIYYRKKYVAMLHPGRCGSTVLGNMLNAHTQISWAGEIFERYMGLEKYKKVNRFTEKMIGMSRDESLSRIYGFETKYLPQYHLSYKCLNLSIENYITLLRNLGFSHFIILHRKNYLRRAISDQVGKQKGEWHSKEQSISPTKVTIDINSFQAGVRKEPLLELFSSMDESLDRLKRSLQSNYLLLTYEEDIQDDPRVGYRKVCEFLNVDDEVVDISLRRTNPFTYEQMVANFEEVKAYLKDTKYSWMLDD